MKQALTAFNGAIEIRRSPTPSSLLMESVAGLIRLNLQRDQLLESKALVQELVQFLLQQGSFDGAEEPFLIYLTCFQALQASGDSKNAVMVLGTAYKQMQQQAEKLQTSAYMRSFVQDVPHNREISKRWQEIVSAS